VEDFTGLFDGSKACFLNLIRKDFCEVRDHLNLAHLIEVLHACKVLVRILFQDPSLRIVVELLEQCVESRRGCFEMVCLLGLFDVPQIRLLDV